MGVTYWDHLAALIKVVVVNDIVMVIVNVITLIVNVMKAIITNPFSN